LLLTAERLHGARLIGLVRARHGAVKSVANCFSLAGTTPAIAVMPIAKLAIVPDWI
jgi:hypothetical protein